MSEILGEQQTSIQSNPLDALTTYVQEQNQELLMARDRFASVESARQVAVDLAAAPFKEPLAAAKLAIIDTERSVSDSALAERLRGLDLEPMAKTVLDIRLRRYGMTVLNFVDGIRNISQGHTAGDTQQVLDSFRFVDSFRRTLIAAEKPLPIGVIHLAWHELIYEDEFSSRRTPPAREFQKRCSAFIGTATIEDLRVVMEDISKGVGLVEVPQPAALELILGNTVHIQTEEERWGDLVSKTTPARLDDATVLVRDTIDPMYDSLNFAASEGMDFSLTWLNTYRHQMHRTDPNKYLVYGDNVRKSINALMEDQAIPHSTKTALSNIRL